MTLFENLDYSAFGKKLGRHEKISADKMMILLVHGAVNNKTSSRDLEKLVNRDLFMKAVFGPEVKVDHSTISRFIKKYPKEIEDVFYQSVKQLDKLGELGKKVVFQDGTKIESRANKYSFVWKSYTERNKEKCLKRMGMIISEAVELSIISFVKMPETEQEIKTAVCSVIQTVEENNLFDYSVKRGSGHKKNKINDLYLRSKTEIEKLSTYNYYLSNLSGRNSLAKTDIDATFMRMKEDYMRNGQLKPGYNIQNAVDSNYVVATSISSDRSDMHTVPHIIEKLHNYDFKYEVLCADSGYDSLTSYHAVKNTKEILLKDGFVELFENKPWEIKEGNKYFITKNGSALIAFKIGDLSNYAFNIASCHTDSPSLKIKGNCLIDSQEGKRINVERYGGLINYSFLDIPLKIGGRAFVKTNEGINQRVIESEFNVNIPSLCIHHNPSVNDGVQLNNQTDMLPLFGDAADLYKALLPNEEIVDADLYCVPFVRPTYTGVNGEYLVSPRIDNLSSLYSITKAIRECNSKGISILYATDNEEIGSLSKQGAESMFLNFVLERINASLGKTIDDFYRAIANGFVLSIDNGHAIHPAHPEKSDPVETVKLNKGVVIKHHPNYATDGLSSSIIKMIANKNNIEIQEYYNRSDLRCGSTIGNITSAKLAINTCDIGLAQLAMHSGIETVGKFDVDKMTNLVKSYFETSIKIDGDNIILE